MTAETLSSRNFPALAAGLCQDSGIDLRFGRNWSFNPERRVIEANKSHIERDPELALGLLAHETSHAWITRYNHLAQGPLGRPIWATFMNGVEDPRANGWIQRRYPGTVPWFRTMYAFDRATPVDTPSRFLAWVAAVSIADSYDWSADASWLVDQPLARDAFERTALARLAYALEIPPPDLRPEMPLSALREAFGREAEPVLSSPAPAHAIDDAERLVLLSAARARAMAVSEILPVARTLVAADERAIGSYLARRPDHAEVLEFGLRQHDDAVLQIVAEALRSSPDDHSDAEAKLARWAFEAYVARRGSSSRLGDGEAVDDTGARLELDRRLRARHRRPAAAADLDHDAIAAAVRKQLPAFVRDLESVLEPQAARRFRSGYASGQRLDLRRAMAYEADRRGYDRLWCRRNRRGPPKAAVSLLVDLSGSMQGQKVHAATIGTMLFAEALDRLGNQVRYAINGFQDELIPFVGFGGALSPATRRAILEMPLEAYGNRADGRNRPSYNDDGPCLAQAADALMREPGQRIMIVVSDGCPSGSRSGKDELRDAIARLTAPRSGLALFGLGLGPDTDHVTGFYPDAIANIPVNEFAARIAGLLKGVLGRPLAAAGR